VIVRAARVGLSALFVTLTLGGCANNIQRSAKLECIRLKHLAALKAARIDRKTEASDCRAA
jgi:hypothetical protein